MNNTPNEIVALQINDLATASAPIISQNGKIYYGIPPQDIASFQQVNRKMYLNVKYMLMETNGMVRLNYSGREKHAPARHIPHLHMDSVAANKFPHVVAVVDVDVVQVRDERKTSHAVISSIITSSASLITYLRWLHSRQLAQAAVGRHCLVPTWGGLTFRATIQLELIGDSNKHEAIMRAAKHLRSSHTSVYTSTSRGPRRRADVRPSGPVTVSSMLTGDALSQMYGSLVSRMNRIVALGMADVRMMQETSGAVQEFLIIGCDIGLFTRFNNVKDPGMMILLLASALNWVRATHHRSMKHWNDRYYWLQNQRAVFSPLIELFCYHENCVCFAPVFAGYHVEFESSLPPQESGVPILMWIQLRHLRVLLHPAPLGDFELDLAQILLSLGRIRAQLGSLEAHGSRTRHTIQLMHEAVEHDISMVLGAQSRGDNFHDYRGDDALAPAHGKGREQFLRQSSLFQQPLMLTDTQGHLQICAQSSHGLKECDFMLDE